MNEIEERGIPIEGADEEPEEIEDVEDEEVQESKPLPPFVKLLILLASVIVLAAGAYFLTKKVILPQVSRSAVGDKITEVKQRLQQPKREDEGIDEAVDEGKGKEARKKSRKKKAKKGEVLRHEIKGITANTAGSMGRRFVVMDLLVETTSEESKKQMGEVEYQIRDALIYYFSGRTVSEIATRDFQHTARDTIRSMINSIIDSEPVDTVFFTTFLIQ
ncbi:flagellar basal body-associated protein FliL [Candidatus Neomarinimicrobiota bacterium]